MARNTNARKPRGVKGKKSHKALKYTLATLAVIVGAGVGFGAYEWNALNPKNHFRANTLPVVGSKTSTTTMPKQQSGTFNVLLIGSDARPGDTASHSDSMVLIHVNLNTHQYNLLSIPRDTRVYFPGYGYTKLTSVQYVDQAKYGTQKGIVDAVQAISQLTGVPINYYAETDYWGLQDMVNALGGITMTLPFNVTLTHAWYKQDQGKVYTKGTHFFMGQDVTEIVHERYSVPGTDYGRQQLQEEALVGIAKAALKPGNIAKLPSLLQSSHKFLIATNMSSTDLMSMVRGIKGNFNTDQMHYRQVKGTSETEYDSVLQANNDEVILDPGQLKSVVKSYFTN